MNQFVDDIGGHKLLLDDFEFIQASTIEQFKNIVKSLVNTTDEKIILWGAVVTKSGTNYTMTAGAIFYNDEIYTVDAITTPIVDAGTPKFKIALSYPSSDPIFYKDGHSVGVHQIRKLTLVASGTAGTEFDYNDATLKDLKTLLKTRLNVVDFSVGVQNFFNSMSNGFVYGPHTPSYFKDSWGTVRFYGNFYTPSSAGSTSAGVVINAGYRPSVDLVYSVLKSDGSIYLVTIKADGSLLLTNSAGAAVGGSILIEIGTLQYNVNI